MNLLLIIYSLFLYSSSGPASLPGVNIHFPFWKVSHGSVVYNISVTGDIDSLEAEAFNKSRMVISFRKKQIRMETDFPVMKTVFIYDEAVSSGVLLCKIPGEKFASEVTGPEVDDFLSMPESEPYFASNGNKRIIAGYACKPASIRTVDGDILNIWYSRKLRPASRIFRKRFQGYPGFPLEYQVRNGNLLFTFTASEVQTSIDPEQFSLQIPDGFRRVNYSQIRDFTRD